MRKSILTKILRTYSAAAIMSLKNQRPRLLLPACLMLGFLVNHWLAVSAFAAEEVCGSCTHKVSVAGEFAHFKVADSVAIEGANGEEAAFRE